MSASEATAEGNPPYWHLQGRELWHVPDESDAFTISFKCRRGPFIAVETPVAEGTRRAAISISSGGKSGRYPARVTEDEVSGAFADANIRRADPVLKAFRATGTLRLSGKWSVDAKTGPERRAITAFFARCPLR
jgi:hypothetical protein